MYNKIHWIDSTDCSDCNTYGNEYRLKDNSLLNTGVGSCPCEGGNM